VILSLLAFLIILTLWINITRLKHKNLRLHSEKVNLNLLTQKESLNLELEQTTKINRLLRNRISQKSDEENKKRDLFIELKSKKNMVKIDVNKIIFIQAEDNGSRIFQLNSNFWTGNTLKSIQSDLYEYQFIQIRRNVIVNSMHIKEIVNDSILLSDLNEIVIGRTYKKKVRDFLSNLSG